MKHCCQRFLILAHVNALKISHFGQGRGNSITFLFSFYPLITSAIYFLLRMHCNLLVNAAFNAVVLVQAGGSKLTLFLSLVHARQHYTGLHPHSQLGPGFQLSLQNTSLSSSTSLTKFIENAWLASVGLSMKRNSRENKILCLMRYYKLLRCANYPCPLYCYLTWNSISVCGIQTWTRRFQHSSTIRRYTLSFNAQLCIQKRTHTTVLFVFLSLNSLFFWFFQFFCLQGIHHPAPK